MLMRTFLCFALILVFGTPNVLAQSQMPEAVREALEEKIRDRPMIEYMEAHYELKQLLDAGEITVQDLQQQLSDLQEALGLDFSKRVAMDRGLISSDSLEFDASETTITAHPNNSDTLVASCISGVATGIYDCPLFYSHDGGLTWTQSNTTANYLTLGNFSTLVGGVSSGDPVLATGSDGTVYFVWISLWSDGVEQYWDVLYATSTDGGVNFTILPPPACQVVHGNLSGSAPFLDREWVAVDNSGTFSDGTVYVSGLLFGGTPTGHSVLAKAPGSTTFSAPVTAFPLTASLDGTQFGNVEVDDDGIVHATCARFELSTWDGEIIYAQSTDQGNSWTTPTVVGTGRMYNQGAVIYAHNRENAANSLGVDGDNVFIAWSDVGGGTVKSYYAYSNDDGATWSSPVEFGPQLEPGPYYHVMPNVAPSGSQCSIAWYAVDSTTLQGKYVIGEIDGSGANLVSSETISHGLTDFGTLGPSAFFGDYNVTVRSGCNSYTIWADGAPGSVTTYVATMDACNLAVPELTPLDGTLSGGKIFPNLANGSSTFEFVTAEAATFSVQIIDASGRIATASKERSFPEGQHSIHLNTEPLASGIYAVRMQRADGVFITRQLVVN